jgi:hypothetical protein
MMKRLLAIVVLMMGVAGYAYASETSTQPQVVNSESGWVSQGTRNDVLLIETTNVALEQALADLAVGFDLYINSDFSTLDLSQYTDVFVAMDGGTIEDASIVNVTNWCSAGGRLHFYGGTCWQSYAIAMNAHLVQNDVNNYCWQTVYGTPHSQVTDAGHYLAANLPMTYNFLDISATYYQMRATDPSISVAAVNGDGYAHLFSKAIGAGTFDICINSPYISYYANPTDYEWLKQVVFNMLNQVPSPVESVTWGAIKALYQ